MTNVESKEEITDVMKELDLMTESLTNQVDSSSEVKPPEVKEPEVKPEPVVEVKEEIKPEVKEEVKVETPEVKVVDNRDKTIEDLRAKLAEKEAAKEPVKKETVVETPFTLEEQDFLKGLDLDDLTRDPKEFNKLLNSFYQRTVNDTRKVLGEGILKSIPDIVRTNLTMMNELKEMSDKFYSENEDLKPFKKVVAAVFEEIASENSDKKYDEVVKLVAPEVRKRLELHDRATKKSDDPPKLPTKGGKAGRSQDKPSIEPLQAELEEMNKTLSRR